MPNLDETTLSAFRDELRKLSAVHPALGAGLTMGALGGLGAGGYGYMKARSEGKSVSDSLGQAAKRGLQGAAIGGAAGAGLGALTPGSVGGAVSRFGQRQLHSVTGWTPSGMSREEGLQSMRAGAYDARCVIRPCPHAL